MSRFRCILLTVLLCSACVLPCYAESMKAIDVEAAVEPNICAESALLYSLDTDKIIYGKNTSERYDPYSVTKMVTAYLILQKLPMDKVVTISEEAADDPAGGSNIDLVEGEQLTVEQLLYGTLIGSGNDAAYALAETCSGDVAGFVSLMNETVQEWGCTNTHFTNPYGWVDDEHYTTADDLLIIAKKCFDDENFVRIAGSRHYMIPSTEYHSPQVLYNHTPRIRSATSGIIAAKTGFWDKDNCSIAMMYCRNEYNGIIILLGDTAKGRKTDIDKLQEYGQTATPGFVTGEKGDVVGKIRVWRSGRLRRADAVLAETTYAYPENGEADSVEIEVLVGIKGGETIKITAPVEKGTVVGEYNVYLDGIRIASKDIIIDEDIGAKR